MTAALKRDRHGLVLTQWITHVEPFTDEFRQHRLDPVVLRGGMTTKARHDALARLNTDASPLVVVATDRSSAKGSTVHSGRVVLAAPIAFKGRLAQYTGRILCPHPAKTTAEVHDFHDNTTPLISFA